MVMRSNDRILVLEKIDKEGKNDSVIDPKVVDGKNKLHCYIDNGMWYFKFEHGLIPAALRDRFTSFKVAREAADTYFKTRNIRIKDVLDDA